MGSAADTYKLIFKGEVITTGSASPKLDAVVPKLAKLLKIPDEQSDVLFSGRAFKLKGNLTLHQAKALHSKFEALGLKLDIIDEKTIASDITEQSKIPSSEKPSSRGGTEEKRAYSEFDVPDRWISIVSEFSEIETQVPENDRDSSLALLTEFCRQSHSQRAFSIPGLIFGFFYYAYLGLFKRGFVLLGISILVAIVGLSILMLFNMTEKLHHALLFLNIGFATLAKADYYQAKVKNRPMYKSFHVLTNTWLVTLFLVFCLWLAVLAQSGANTIRHLMNGEDIAYLEPIMPQAGDSRSQNEKSTSLVLESMVDENGYFVSYEALVDYSKRKYGTKEGVVIHEVN